MGASSRSRARLLFNNLLNHIAFSYGRRDRTWNAVVGCHEASRFEARDGQGAEWEVKTVDGAEGDEYYGDLA